MRIIMFVCSDADPDPQGEAPGEIQAWVGELESRGKRLDGDRLRPPGSAKTVRVRNGRRHVTDGPYTESREVILGFDILECDSLEEAVEIASRHPMARAGRIELREVWPMD